MAKVKVKVKFDQRKWYQKFNKKINKAQTVMNRAILKDSNMLAPKKTGDLRSSGQATTSNITWDKYYASYVYDKKGTRWSSGTYANPTTPGTYPRWFEVAKERFADIWIKKFKKAFRRT